MTDLLLEELVKRVVAASTPGTTRIATSVVTPEEVSASAPETQARVVTGDTPSVQPVVPSAATSTAMSVANGVPMDLKQMRRYLQGRDGVPVVLRERGTVHITCPYCGKLHDHGRHAGFQVAGCDDNVRYGIGIFVGERYFVPNFGYQIYEYREGDDGIYELTIP
jgi:hypothetical protein